MITLPVYIVVDTSASLMGDMDDVNAALAELIGALQEESIVGELVRVAVIQFASEAREAIPLSDVRELGAIPALVAHGATNYGPVFRLVRRLIVRDVAALKAAGGRVFRPVVFFVSDGSPVDPSWREDLRGLHSSEFRERPTIVTFGIGSVDPDVLREIGTNDGGAFMVSTALGVGDAIRSVFGGLMTMLSSTVQSTTSPDKRVPPIALSDDWLDLTAVPGTG
ncbi:vWA domain-containing protein [Nostocoides veronense]|uniref:VWFA domain-containing protein n=1 Tax=Nostocoides veronense TaxID=330836 RepID=A0ABN2L9F1_9MICO